MDYVLLRLADAQRALQAELARVPEDAALSALRRLIRRARAARYDRHARSMTELESRIRGYPEELPVFHLLQDLGRLIKWRAAMVGPESEPVSVKAYDYAVDVWINEGGAVRCDEDG